MVIFQEVRQLELLCKQLYESQNPENRAEAEKALVGFQNAPDTLSKCQLLLQRADSSYAQLLAATTLTRLVSRSAQSLSLQQRIDIREFCIQFNRIYIINCCRNVCFELPRDAAETVELCRSSAGYAICADHQIGMVRLREGGRARIQECNSGRDEFLAGLCRALHDWCPAPVPCDERNEPDFGSRCQSVLNQA